MDFGFHAAPPIPRRYSRWRVVRYFDVLAKLKSCSIDMSHAFIMRAICVLFRIAQLLDRLGFGLALCQCENTDIECYFLFTITLSFSSISQDHPVTEDNSARDFFIIRRNSLVCELLPEMSFNVSIFIGNGLK